jgi:carbon monoxide dehydrogenase subunit G
VTTVSDNVRIARKPEDVFSFITNPLNTPLWQPTVVETNQKTPGPLGVGTRVIDIRRFLGRRIEGEWEVTEHDPPRRSAIRAVSGPIPFSGSYTLMPVEEGTQLTWLVDLEAAGFFRLAEPIFAQMARRELASSLGHLKDLLEAGIDRTPLEGTATEEPSP